MQTNNEQNETIQASDEDRRRKNDADSGNDLAEIKQEENLIDPGNEHKHDAKKESGLDDNSSANKHDADSGGDATGSMGSKPE